MKKLLLPIAAVAALSVALFTVASVGAQEGTDGAPVQTFVGKLAAKLGISEDQLATAVKDVEYDDVVRSLQRHREPLLAVVRRVDRMPFFLQHAPDQLRQPPLVFDHQYVHHSTSVRSLDHEH